MITLVEGASRQKTPNEIALNILIAGLTLIFLMATVTLLPFGLYAVGQAGHGSGAVDYRADRAAGLLDSHHHRRAAFGHRHRGHGPGDAVQRPRHERQGGGSGGRRGCAAARQDRHDHARQPAGGGVYSAAGRRYQRAGRCRAAFQLGRRDARGAQHRRARQGEIQLARAAYG